MLLTQAQLEQIGFASIGKNVRISAKASIYGASRISIGDNVRIDDFVVLSAGAGGIEIGSHIHLAVFCSLIGAGKIVLEDFCNFSSRVSIYSSNDDYSGEWMTNPCVPAEFTNVTHGTVHVGAHTIIGSGSVVLPNVHIGKGCSIGALSMVGKDCEAFGIYAGVPAKFIKKRSDKLLELEAAFRKML